MNYEKIYPEVNEKPDQEDDIDEVSDGQSIIDLIQDGAPSGYKINGMDMEGKRISREHILSIVLNGRNAPQKILRLWKKIYREKKQLEKIDIRACKTQKSYTDQVSSICTVIPKNMWFQKLREKYEVPNWAELKKRDEFKDYDEIITAPSNVQIILDGLNQISISWDASTAGHSGVSAYRIYADGRVIASTQTLTYVHPKALKYNTEYSIQIEAINGDGFISPKTDIVTVKTEEEPAQV